jgi:hypothetical protein
MAKRKRVSAPPLRMMRNSETQTYKACRQKWYWSYVEHYKPNQVQAHFTVGSMVHAGLEHWYIPGRKRGVHPAKTVNRLYKEWLTDGGREIKVKVGGGDSEDDSNYVEINELMIHMMTNYVDTYGKDDFIEVLAPEQLFRVDVYDEHGRYVCTQVGQIDLCFRDRRTNRIGFMEHKTGSTLMPFGAPESLDEQSGTYWTYGPQWLKHTGQIPEEAELDFIMFNRMRKAFKSDKPTNAEGLVLNKDGSVSKRQPAPLFKRSMVYRNAHDSDILNDRVIAVSREMQMIERGELEVYKHPDKHCGFCEFKDVCEVHESGGDYQTMFDMMFLKWEPYSEHELEMEATQ